MPIVKPKQTALERLTGGFTQGLGIANALQQMAQKRRAQQFAEKMQPLKMQQLQAQIGQAEKLSPLKLQQLQAQIESEKAQALLRRQQAQTLGAKGGAQIQLGPTGLPFAIPPQMQASESPVPHGVNPVDPQNTSISKTPFSTDQSLPGNQPSYIPSPIRGTKGTVSSWYNPYTGETLSALSTTGRTQIQNQLQSYKAIKRILPDLKKYGSKGYGGAPMSPNLLHPLSFVDQIQNPDAAPFYSMSLNTGKEQLLSARGLPKSKEGLHTTEGILGRLPGEHDDTYIRRMDKFEKEEVDKKIEELSGALRISARRIPAVKKQPKQPSLSDSQLIALARSRNIKQ